MVKPKKLQTESAKNNQIIYFIGLLILTFILYFPSLKNQFTNWDDDAYVPSNPNIELTKENMKKSFFEGEYHRMYAPLTALSHSIVYHYYKLNPKPYIFINLLIHLLNVLLVFVFVSLLIKKPYVPLLIAALFALHPMQVESVAFIAGRRDVLYVFFYLLCLIFYIKSIDRKKPYFIKYILSVVFALMAMLSKGQALTIPATLILLSFFFGANWKTKAFWLDKIPFIILAAILAYKVFMAPQYASAAYTNSSYLVTTIPLYNRLIYACFGFVQYIILLLVPYKLSLAHPYPMWAGQHIIPAYYYFYVAAFAALVFLFFKYALKDKILWFGIAFFAVNMVMLLQILPNSYGLLNDHYVYFAGAGVFLILCQKASEKFRTKKSISLLYVFFALYVIILCGLSYQRIEAFNNSVTIWTDVIKKYPECDVAYNNRGDAYDRLGLSDKAISNYSIAINISPNYAEAYSNRGYDYITIGLYNKAIDDFDHAIKLTPDFALAYLDRGIAKQKLGLNNEAIKDYTKAAEAKPDYDWAYFNRAFLLGEKGLIDDAIKDYTKAITCNPGFANAWFNRGGAWLKKGDKDKACMDFKKAQKLGYSYDYDKINEFCK